MKGSDWRQSTVKNKNFRGANLRGKSFRGQDLSGIDFSGADLRGTNFYNATLKAANFSGARAGRQPVAIVLALFLAGLSGFLAGSFAIIIGYFLTSQNPANIVTGAVSLVSLVAFLFLTHYRGFTQAFGIVLGSFTSSSILAAIVAVVFDWVVASETAIAAASTFSLGILVAITVLFVLAYATVVTKRAVAISLLTTTFSAVVIPLVTTTIVATGVVQAGIIGHVLTGAIGFVIILVSIRCAQLALANSEQHTLIRRIAIAGATIGGTSFRGADLTWANFSQAILEGSDLRDTDLTYTNWYQAKKLDRTRTEGTILMQPAVRTLLASGDGYGHSYQGCNLRGAYLKGTDLRDANLTEADLSGAFLQNACLERANLTKVQAIGTDFSNAQFTGAYGLGTWNIDGTTRLDQVDCRFVYLEASQSEDGEHSTRRNQTKRHQAKHNQTKHNQTGLERRPSSGEFAAGEFTKLFETVVHTIDLIFQDGINWQALSATLDTVRTKNQGIDFTVQSIENKGNGFIVVKVGVPQEVDKEKIHREFKRLYDQKLSAIEAKYQAELKSKQEQLEIYRQTSADLSVIAKQLAMGHSNQVIHRAEDKQILTSKRIVLLLGEGDFRCGFPATAQLWTDKHLLPIHFNAKLPPEARIGKLYRQWQHLYRAQRLFNRIVFDETDPITNFSRTELDDLGWELEQRLNRWLNSDWFASISNKLREKLSPADEVLMMIQTQNLELQRLPWHLWDFFSVYRKAETALSTLIGDRIANPIRQRSQIRILAVLGNSEGIDVAGDRQVLENLPQAQTVFLVEPTREQLNAHLWDEQGWDILCFSGHSSSLGNGNTGVIQLNHTDQLSLKALRYALQTAIERGLQLAIFNSCDGLGLALQLQDLHIPQTIVMREPVPDRVAQTFLKHFLTTFSRGESFYIALRQAREQLEGLEDEFPYATWLPTAFQNPAEISMNWQTLSQAES